MPFSSLELFRGGYYEEGKMPAPTKLMSEDEVFEQLIYNPDNEHRSLNRSMTMLFRLKCSSP